MPLPARLAAVAASQAGLFTTAQAVAAGYHPNEITRLRRSGDWARPRRGVYIERALVPSDPKGKHLLLLRAALLTLHSSSIAAASHISGAVMLDIALLDSDLSLIHITREGAYSARTVDGVRYHHAALPSSHLTKIDDVVATGAARTVVDLARRMAFDVALVAAESALNKELTTLAELRHVLADCVDWPGARRAQRVVDFASPLSESPGETLGRIAFDVLGIPQPDQQVYIFDQNGFIGRSDYYWTKHHTVGEFDGKLKYTDGRTDGTGDDALAREKKREDRLREAGLEVCRFEWAESRACAQSVRRKTLGAFRRAEQRRDRRTYFVKRQLPPR